MKIFFILLFMLAIFQTSCFAVVSGEIQNTTVKKFIEAVTNNAMKNNNRIYNLQENSVTIITTTSFMEKVFNGSRFNSTPERHFTITATQNDKNVLIQLTASMVTNPGSGFQIMRNLPYEEIQAMRVLEKKYNSHYEFGFEYKDHPNFVKVTFIDENVISYQQDSEKLDYGDRIIAVNDNPINFKYSDLLNNDEIPTIKQAPEILKLTVKNKKMPEKFIYLKRVYVKSQL